MSYLVKDKMEISNSIWAYYKPSTT